MERMRKTIVAMSMLALGSVGGVAVAQDTAGAEVDGGGAGGTPTNYTQRPLTLRQRTLRVDVAPPDYGLMDSGMLLGDVGGLGSYGIRVGQTRTHIDNPDPAPDVTTTDAYGSLGIGAAYGVLDRLEVGGLILPLRFDQGNVYGNMAFYARGTLVESSGFALGLQGTLSLPTLDNLGIGVGVPINAYFGGNMRLETGVEAEFILDVEDDNGNGSFVNLDVPLAFSVGLGNGFVGGKTGFTLIDLGGGNTAVIPVGAIGGYTLAAGPTLIDLKGSFLWNFLADGDSTGRASYWALMFGANVHIGL